MSKSVYSADYAAFLKHLRRTRKNARLTQVQLADRLGMTQAYVSRSERGERRVDIVELRAICSAIGITLSEFLEGFEQSLQPKKKSRAEPKASQKIA